MNIPHKHHFIPAFFLEQWVGNDGKLFEYSIKNRRVIVKPVGAKATGFEFDLYAFSELPAVEAQFIEQTFFNYADHTASLALDSHLKNAPTSAWDSELISAWSRFVVALHLRHPDAVPELKQAAQDIWNAGGVASQGRYEALKMPDDPATFDEFLAQRDPLTDVKVRVNLIAKTFDNDILGAHLNGMRWAIFDVSAAQLSFLLSDRPVTFYRLREPDGYVALPIGPKKLFVGANHQNTINTLRRIKPDQLVRNSNLYLVKRARRYVWARSESQSDFIKKYMSTEMEPTPLFPNLGAYPQSDA